MTEFSTRVYNGMDGEAHIEVSTDHYTEVVDTTRAFPFWGLRPADRVARIVERTGRRLAKKERKRNETYQALKERGVF